jgi:transposase
MKHIGDEITETVDYYPEVLVKRRYIRRKYVRIESEESETQLVIGELPKRVIPKGIAEAGLLAYIIVSKYVDHLPFYRLIEKFKREHDWNIQKSTLNDWFAACCKLLEPLYEELKKQVLQTDYLQADESSKNIPHQGYMWVYRNGENGLVLFDYRKGRGMDGPSELLKDFSGYLQCDGIAV